MNAPGTPGAARGRTILLLAVSAVVAIAVVVGFLALGTPATERERRLDDTRLEDLRALRSRVAGHFRRTGVLPTRLGAMDTIRPGGAGLLDPASHDAYGYEVVDDSTFRLCATFDHPTEDEPARIAYDAWAHGAGPTCYRFRITDRPELPVGLEPEPLLEPGTPRRR